MATKAGSAYIDIDADLTKARSTLASANLTADVELDPDMQDLRAKLRSGHLMADLGIDIDRTQITAQLAGLTSNLRLDVDRTDISTQLAAMGVDINVRPDYSSLVWTRNEIIAYLSGIWVDLNVRLDASTVAMVQAQLAALAAQAASLGSGAGFLGGAAAGGGSSFLTGAALGVGGAAAVGGAAILGLGAYGASVASDFEQADMALSRFLGSSEAADKHIEDLKAFAVQTPFEFTGLRASSLQLQAVGIAAEDVIPILSVLGDATSATGTGQEGLARGSYALMQVMQKGTVQADEMKQLAQAGIPAWEALASHMGISVEEAMKKVSKREVPSETLFDAIADRSGTAFKRIEGGMAEAATTLNGQLSNLKDTFDITLGEMMTPLLPALVAMIGPIKDSIVPLFEEHLVPALEDFMPLIETLIEGFGPFLGLFMDFAGGMAEALQPAMEVIMPMLVDLAEQLGPKMEEAFPELAEAFIAIAEAMVELAPFIPPTLDLLTGITIAQANAVEAIASAFAWMADIFAGPIAAVMGEIVSSLGELVRLDFTAAGERAIGWVNSLMEAFPRMVNWLIEQWNRLDFSIDVDLPEFMGGGSIHTGDIIPDVNAGFLVIPPRGPAPAASTTGVNRSGGVKAFHTGGVFEAPQGRSEGLALLRNREVIFTPEQMDAMSRGGGSSTPVENHLYLDGREFGVLMTQIADTREKSLR